jgi:hypothetical protein
LIFFLKVHTYVNFNNFGVAPEYDVNFSAMLTLAAVNFVVVLDCLAKFYMAALCLICCMMPEEVGRRQRSMC